VFAKLRAWLPTPDVFQYRYTASVVLISYKDLNGVSSLPWFRNNVYDLARSKQLKIVTSYPPGGVLSIEIRVFVCLSVCLSDRISQNSRVQLHAICGRSSILLWRKCNM